MSVTTQPFTKKEVDPILAMIAWINSKYFSFDSINVVKPMRF